MLCLVLYTWRMTRTEAIEMFGGRVTDLARALGVSRTRIYQMPEVLRPGEVDRINGAAVRLGITPKVVPQQQSATA